MVNNHRPILILIAGPNGSGKTTITSQILHHSWLENCKYINPDNIAQEVFGDWNSTESVIKAAQYASQLREQYLKENQSMIFETVLSAPDKLDFIYRAKQAGYFIRLFFISTNSPTINAARVADRVFKGGHDVPIPKIISRYYKSIENCARAISMVDRCYLYDNSIDGHSATAVARFSDGKLIKKYTANIPVWAAGFIAPYSS